MAARPHPAPEEDRPTPLELVANASPAIRSLPEGRRRIVSTLKRHGEMDVEALAAAVRMTTSGVRQHMIPLGRDGLVAHRTESAGPGRPRHIYRLSEAGDALFPRRYADLTNELLGYLADEDPEMLQRIFVRRGERRLADARLRTDGMPFDERVREVAAILDDDGYLADCVREDDGTWIIREHNCAVLNVALRFGHACGTELSFLRALLPDATVERVSHRVAGHHACAYRVIPAGS
ncbi:MAG TPA: hypothetical protein VGT61_03610 [Thermomicrobiales bacterium]|jgi:DeoR family suf operon transcriptional repressor|nr:hypothetical protein [Thermomicrobiales bacterium]